MIQEILPTAVQKQHESAGDVILVDVREVNEFSGVSVPYAKNFPLSTFEVNDVLEAYKLDLNNDTVPIYFICASGWRSQKAAEIFQEAGYEKVFNVSGGMQRWLADKLPRH